MFVVMWKLLKI